MRNLLDLKLGELNAWPVFDHTLCTKLKDQSWAHQHCPICFVLWPHLIRSCSMKKFSKILLLGLCVALLIFLNVLNSWRNLSSIQPLALGEFKIFESQSGNVTHKECKKETRYRGFLKSVNRSQKNDESRPPRVFCLIYTMPKYFGTRARAVLDTWAKKCDKHKFITSVPLTEEAARKLKPNLHSIELNHRGLEILQPAGHRSENEIYQKLSSKLFITLMDVYNRYDDFDWYLKADDDTFIVVDNMIGFLENKNPCEPVSYGYNFKINVPGGECTNGRDRCSHRVQARFDLVGPQVVFFLFQRLPFRRSRLSLEQRSTHEDRERSHQRLRFVFEFRHWRLGRCLVSEEPRREPGKLGGRARPRQISHGATRTSL